MLNFENNCRLFCTFAAEYSSIHYYVLHSIQHHIYHIIFKRMKQTLFLRCTSKTIVSCLLTTVMIFGLTACSDTTDNPAIPSTDSEITVYTDNIDETLHPGDDFYMYCIGSWWKRTEIPAGSDHQAFLFGEAQEQFNEKTQSSQPPTLSLKPFQHIAMTCLSIVRPTNRS